VLRKLEHTGSQHPRLVALRNWSASTYGLSLASAEFYLRIKLVHQIRKTVTNLHMRQRYIASVLFSSLMQKRPVHNHFAKTTTTYNLSIDPESLWLCSGLHWILHRNFNLLKDVRQNFSILLFIDNDSIKWWNLSRLLFLDECNPIKKRLCALSGILQQ